MFVDVSEALICYLSVMPVSKFLSCLWKIKIDETEIQVFQSRCAVSGLSLIIAYSSLSLSFLTCVCYATGCPTFDRILNTEIDVNIIEGFWL